MMTFRISLFGILSFSVMLKRWDDCATLTFGSFVYKVGTHVVLTTID